MTEPTPIRSHRRYSKRQKATAVIAAEMSSMAEAAKATGIPLTTIDYWMDQPEFVALRMKTREDMAEESSVLAHRTLAAIKDRLPQFEPRDLVILFGVLVDKAQLLSGMATARTETRSLSDGLDDHEKAQLRAILDEALKEAAVPT